MSNEPIQSEFDLLKDRYNKELKTLKLYSIYIILYCISTILTFFNYFIFINLSDKNSIAYLLEKLNQHYYLSIFIIIIIIICLLVASCFTIIKPYIYFYRQKEISFDILKITIEKN